VIFVTDEQRQILNEDGVPMPLIDGHSGKCYMVMPVEFSADKSGIFSAHMPGFGAIAEAEIPSDAVVSLAILMRKMLEQD
jgi:hypothetical protein